MNEKNRDPWLLVVLKGQWFRTEALALAAGPWVLWAIVVVLASALTAFPLVNDRFAAALKATEVDRYPGLEAVFQASLDGKWGLAVDQGQLHTAPGAPAQTRVGDWLVVIEPAGGDSQALARAAGLGGTSGGKVAFFGKTRFGLLDRSTQTRFDGAWTKLEGFRSADLARIPLAQILPLVLYAGATGALVPEMYGFWALILGQLVLLALVVGFALSRAATAPGGFWTSVKTAGFQVLGPAVVVALVLSFCPGWGFLSWVVFTLLFGLRVALVTRGQPRPN